MTPYYQDKWITIHHGDCREVMKELADCSVDSIVTDPPYELGFMGKGWDKSGIAYNVEVWRECLRVLKPGGHLLAFGGSRTYHRLACAIEDAGFEIRDQIQWIYGSGFPKSLDVSKAIDRMRNDNAERQAVGSWLREQREAKGLTQKAVAAFWPSVTGGLTGCVANWELGFNCPTWEQWLALKELVGFGAEMDAEVWRLNGRKGKPGDNWQDREVIGFHDAPAKSIYSQGLKAMPSEVSISLAATDAAKQWNGWGTALKPAHEPIVVARKPLVGTVAENVLKYGTGGLNIDGCRVELNGYDHAEYIPNRVGYKDGIDHCQIADPARRNPNAYDIPMTGQVFNQSGRWPANVIHDGSEEVLAGFPETADSARDVPKRGNGNPRFDGVFGSGNNTADYFGGYTDTGNAARFFYCAKASKEDREHGLDLLPIRSAGEVTDRKDGSDGLNSPRAGAGRTSGSRNFHPTVKPTDLMRYLCRLVTPPRGTVLDPFCGSGSTGKAAALEEFKSILIDLDIQHCELAANRAPLVQESFFSQ